MRDGPGASEVDGRLRAGGPKGRKHPGHAPLVCRGEVIGASLEALGAEGLGLVEGIFLDLADAVADALVRQVEDCTLGRVPRSN